MIIMDSFNQNSFLRGTLVWKQWGRKRKGKWIWHRIFQITETHLNQHYPQKAITHFPILKANSTVPTILKELILNQDGRRDNQDTTMIEVLLLLKKDPSSKVFKAKNGEDRSRDEISIDRSLESTQEGLIRTVKKVSFVIKSFLIILLSYIRNL